MSQQTTAILAADGELTTCHACEARYRPALVGGDCPLCGTTWPDWVEPTPQERQHRLVMLLIAATIANLMILGLTAALTL